MTFSEKFVNKKRRAFISASASEANATESYLDALEAEDNNPPSPELTLEVRRTSKVLGAAEAAFKAAEAALLDAMGWYDTP